MAKVGDIFFLPAKDNPIDPDAELTVTECDPMTGIVIAAHPHDENTFVYTPIYDHRHFLWFDTVSGSVVDEGVKALRAESEWHAMQQEAEIAAETNIPQHLVW